MASILGGSSSNYVFEELSVFRFIYTLFDVVKILNACSVLGISTYIFGSFSIV